MVWSCENGHSYTMDTGVWERHEDDTHPHNHQLITSREENSAHANIEQTQSSAYSHLHAKEPEGETGKISINGHEQMTSEAFTIFLRLYKCLSRYGR